MKQHIKLSQETVLKHFMKRTETVPVNDPSWITQAQKNHQERGGTGTLPANTNTLLLVKSTQWDNITTGNYFGEHDLPPRADAQLALVIHKEDIDRIITTKKNGLHYDVVHDLVGNAVRNVTFLCSHNGNVYTIVHFEGLD